MYFKNDQGDRYDGLTPRVPVPLVLPPGLVFYNPIQLLNILKFAGP